MLIKIDLPISQELAEELLYPPVYTFIQSNVLRLDKPGKIWMASDSYIVYVADGVIKVYNLYNKRFFRVRTSECLIVPENIYACSRELGWRYSPAKERLSTWSRLVVFRQIDTFQQNDLGIIKEIRGFVNENLQYAKTFKKDNHNGSVLYGIGGEFYLYFIFNRNYYQKFYGFSNSNAILGIAHKNLNNYLTCKDYALRLVKYDYMTIPAKEFQDTRFSLIVNLSTVPLNIFRLMVLHPFHKLVIITCSQKIFNKRKSMLDRTYKLIDFKHVPSKISSTIVSVYVYLRR